MQFFVVRFLWVFLFLVIIGAGGGTQASAFLECQEGDPYCEVLETLLRADECPEKGSARTQDLCRGLKTAVLGRPCLRKQFHDPSVCHSVEKGYDLLEPEGCDSSDLACRFGEFVKLNYSGAFYYLHQLETKMELFQAKFQEVGKGVWVYQGEEMSEAEFQKVSVLARKILKFSELDRFPAVLNYVDSLTDVLVAAVLSGKRLIPWRKEGSGAQKQVEFLIDSETQELYVKGTLKSLTAEAKQDLDREKAALRSGAGEGFPSEVLFDPDCRLPHVICLQYYPLDFFELMNQKIFERAFVGPFPRRTVLYRITEQLLTGLKRIHGQGLFHLDIKPENLVFDWSTGSAAYIDLGMSHRQSPSDGAELYRSRGTTAFKIPFLRKQFDTLTWGEMGSYLPRMDLFSLGISLELVLNSRKWRRASCVGSGLMHRVYTQIGKNDLIAERADIRDFKSLNRVFQASFNQPPRQGTLERVYYELFRSGADEVTLEEVLSQFAQVPKPPVLPVFHAEENR